MVNQNPLITIKDNLKRLQILHSEEEFLSKPAVIGYEKRFRWAWLGTQLNTFVIASDYGDETITEKLIKDHLAKAFSYARKNNRGLPRFFFGGIAAISILIGTNLPAEVKEFCHQLKSGKKWGLAIPVAFDKITGEVHSFDYDPLWGAIFMPYLRRMIAETTKMTT